MPGILIFKVLKENILFCSYIIGFVVSPIKYTVLELSKTVLLLI